MYIDFTLTNIRAFSLAPYPTWSMGMDSHKFHHSHWFWRRDRVTTHPSSLSSQQPSHTSLSPCRYTFWIERYISCTGASYSCRVNCLSTHSWCPITGSASDFNVIVFEISISCEFCVNPIIQKCCGELYLYVLELSLPQWLHFLSASVKLRFQMENIRSKVGQGVGFNL